MNQDSAAYFNAPAVNPLTINRLAMSSEIIAGIVASSAAHVESAVNEILAWRMSKAQQMRRSRVAVQPFYEVRKVALDDTIESAFRNR